ncbi:tetratricopeptide repeat protein [Pyruvatibacter sp.]|uniref:tetratricopeptide repeat protein n=1 Tax=Pyruvatibacter sp. TaxID=1981328 RepID=UPI0032662AE1
MQLVLNRPGVVRPGMVRIAAIGLAASLLAGCAGFGGIDARDFDNSTVGKNLRVDGAGRNVETKLGNYLAARHATNLRDRDAAAVFYDQVLSEDPSNDVILDRAFLLQLTAGNISRAGTLAEKVIAQDPGDRTARLVLGVQDIKAGRFAGARGNFDSAAAGPFTRLVSGLLTAWTYVGEGNYPKAFESLSLEDDGPGHTLFSAYHTALIADLAGDKVRAREAYETAMSSSGGGSVRIVDAYGRFLERNGQADDAVVIYSGYLALSPSHPIISDALARARSGDEPGLLVTSTRAGTAEALYGIGSALSRDQGVDVSILYLQLALYMYDNLDVAQVLLAELLSNSGDLSAAAETYDDVSSSSSLATTARIERALLLDRIGRTDDAIDALSSLGDRSTDAANADVAIALADLYRSTERFDRAEAGYTRALNLLQSQSSRLWTLYYARGVARERQGKWDGAEADFMKALELEPDQPYVLNYLAYSWLEQDINLEEALEMIQKAVDQRPNDGFIVDSLGWAFYQMGRYEEAVEQLERAVELDPNDATINDHLGDAFWKVGRRTEARFQWQHALENDPEEDVALRIARKLEKGLEAVEAAEAATPAAGS